MNEEIPHLLPVPNMPYVNFGLHVYFFFFTGKWVGPQETIYAHIRERTIRDQILERMMVGEYPANGLSLWFFFFIII